MQLECKLDQYNDKYPKLDKYETLLGPNVDDSDDLQSVVSVKASADRES